MKQQIAELKSQHTNNQQNTSQVVSKDKIALANQKYEEARKFLNEKDYECAIKLYDEVIQLNPNFSTAYYYRRICYQKLGNTEKAHLDFKKSDQLRRKG